MFGRPSRVERLYEARIEDLKKEHQRTVEALTAWIEQLQLQVGAATQIREQYAEPLQTERPVNTALYMGDDEEALYDAHANGLIDGEQLEEGLKQIGFMNKEVIAT